MADRVQLEVAAFRGLVVEQDHRAVASDEEVLERQHLAPVAQWALCQQAHLREAVEDHSARVGLADTVEQLAGGFAQLDLGRVQHRQLQFRVETGFRCDQFEHINTIQ